MNFKILLLKFNKKFDLHQNLNVFKWFACVYDTRFIYLLNDVTTEIKNKRVLHYYFHLNLLYSYFNFHTCCQFKKNRWNSRNSPNIKLPLLRVTENLSKETQKERDKDEFLKRSKWSTMKYKRIFCICRTFSILNIQVNIAAILFET